MRNAEPAGAAIRHIMPGFGYFPDDPAHSPVSGITSVAYHLARESTRLGGRVEVVSFSNGHDRPRVEVEGIVVRRVRPRSLLALPRLDYSYAGPVMWLGLRQAVDIAHVHSNPYLLRSLRASRRVLHFHTPEFSASPAYRRAVSQADEIIFCSAAIRDRFVSIVGDVSRPLRVVPNGVDLERFTDDADARAAFRRRYGIGEDEFVILFAGAITPAKGPHVLVEAARRVREESRRSIRLVFAGSSALWQSAGRAAATTPYEETLAAAADPAWVTFTGSLPQHEMPAAYAACDLLVCPSIWPEPFGIVVAEAMASGKPVVASAVGGLPELIADGETGMLVPADDVAALARAVLACAEEPDRGKQLGAAAQRDMQRFTWRSIGEAVWRIYRGDHDTSMDRR